MNRWVLACHLMQDVCRDFNASDDWINITAQLTCEFTWKTFAQPHRTESKQALRYRWTSNLEIMDDRWRNCFCYCREMDSTVIILDLGYNKKTLSISISVCIFFSASKICIYICIICNQGIFRPGRFIFFLTQLLCPWIYYNHLKYS